MIVPRVGAFIVSYREANMNAELGVMEAPRKEICFNGAIRHSDGLVASSIARREKISYHAASEILNNAVDELVETLAINAEVTVGHVGSLRLTKENRIEFIPFYSDEAYCRRYGMPNIAIPRIPQLENNLQDKARYFMLPRKIVKIAAAIAILITGALSFLLPGISAYSPLVDQASMLPLEKIIGEDADSITQTKSTKTCAVVVASFATIEKAQEYVISQSENEDLDIEYSKEHYRVIALKGDSPEALIDSIATLEFSSKYPGAWVWERQ